MARKPKAEMERIAPRYGEEYVMAELALVYLIKRDDTTRAVLAALMGRTQEAVEMLWRWMEGRNFPSEATSRVARQIKTLNMVLGDEARGSVELETSGVLQRLLTVWQRSGIFEDEDLIPEE